MSIGSLRKKLHDSIKKYGIDSERTYRASVELDQEIVKYYANSPMKLWYKESYEALTKYQQQMGNMPSIKEWNQLAKEQNYLSSESMKYIGNIKFQ